MIWGHCLLNNSLFRYSFLILQRNHYKCEQVFSKETGLYSDMFFHGLYVLSRKCLQSLCLKWFFFFFLEVMSTGGSRLMGWVLSHLLSQRFLLLSPCSVGLDVKSSPLLLTTVAMCAWGWATMDWTLWNHNSKQISPPVSCFYQAGGCLSEVEVTPTWSVKPGAEWLEPPAWA